jgi:zinc/manganese transport system substrate-binding protein
MRGVAAVIVASGLGLAAAQAAPLNVVAAENFYGDVATQLGGSDVQVTSILSNPDEDPHLFEASPSTARAIAGAAIVIFNGADYDPWMAKLLAASPAAHRDTIEVAALVHRKPGDNPHLWYDPGTMPALARSLTAALIQRAPARRADFEARLAKFDASLAPLNAEVAHLRQAYKGTPATATEPVFGYMAAAIGLDMRNERFQLAVMNDTEPGAAEIAAFQNDLEKHAVKVLFYNVQTSEALTERMKAVARKSGVPVVGVSETEPPGTTYQAWMLSQLDALDRALSGKTP